MPAGRPTKYKPEYCQMIIDFMSKGEPLMCFAAHIGVNKTTIYEWAKVHEEFSNALGHAKEKCQAHWWSVGVNGMFLGEDGKKTIDPILYKFLMASRFGWSDKQQIEQTVKADGKLVIEGLDESDD